MKQEAQLALRCSCDNDHLSGKACDESVKFASQTALDSFPSLVQPSSTADLKTSLSLACLDDPT